MKSEINLWWQSFFAIYAIIDKWSIQWVSLIDYYVNNWSTIFASLSYAVESSKQFASFVNLNNIICLSLNPTQLYVTWTVICNQSSNHWNISRGGHLYFRLDIIRVKRLSEHTLNTYFSCMKIDPKYAFLHAFFCILSVMSFPKFVIWPKTYPFFQFCTFLHP